MIKNLVAQHESTLHGNGQPGIVDFISGLRGQLRLIMAFMIFITALATAVGALVATIALDSQKRTSIAPSIFHSHNAEPVLSFERKQDAQIPLMRR